MKVDVFFSPRELQEAAVEGRVAVVIDVIRATSTMVEALAQGARAIFPTVSTDEAIKLASSLGRKDSLLCGERKGLKVDGFDLGNSPREFTPETVAGKQLVMSTTNGTRAFLVVEDAGRVLAASFLNLTAVAGAVKSLPTLAVVCAGKEDRFALDDALCAGALIRRIVEIRGDGGGGGGGELELNDAARAARELAERHALHADFLRSTAAGAALVEVGLEGDLEDCAALDRHSLVPEMKDRRIALPRRKGSK